MKTSEKLRKQFLKETGKPEFVRNGFAQPIEVNPEYFEWLETKAGQHETIVVWRFLKKEMPSDGEKVLIAIDDKVDYGTIKDYEVATFDGSRFFDSYGEFVNNVTRWQRIEPP